MAFTSYKSNVQVQDEPTYRNHLAVYMDYPNRTLLGNWAATASIAGTCFTTNGFDSTSGSFSFVAKNSAGLSILEARNDRATLFHGLIKNGVGTTIADINSGFYLADNAGNPVIYLGAKQLYTSGGAETLNWSSRYVKNSGGTQTLSWEACSLSDAAGVDSIYWSVRKLFGNTGATVIDYSKPATLGLPNVQTGNAGLLSGECYFDTAANILANGDLVMGRKV